ncbi:DUF4282 domain-containing protein [Corynebacterium wankanglinii]|nr:DUF4282 domain-containing protein [Corynebacterium wankanglinii]
MQPQHGENQYGQQGQYSQAQYGQSQYSQQSYTQPQYGQGQYGQGSTASRPSTGSSPRPAPSSTTSRSTATASREVGQGNGFFNALFDLSFSRYITVDFMRVIYAISLGLIVLAWVAGLLFSFAGFGDSFGGAC